jgi:transposase InsO family protein
LGEHVGRVWREHPEVYGVRKVWKQLQREGHPVARCTVARLMRQRGFRGAVRGRKFKITVNAGLHRKAWIALPRQDRVPREGGGLDT